MQNKDDITKLQYKYHTLVLFMHTKKDAWWLKWVVLSTLLLPLKMELKIFKNTITLQ